MRGRSWVLGRVSIGGLEIEVSTNRRTPDISVLRTSRNTLARTTSLTYLQFLLLLEFSNNLY